MREGETWISSSSQDVTNSRGVLPASPPNSLHTMVYFACGLHMSIYASYFPPEKNVDFFLTIKYNRVATQKSGEQTKEIKHSQ